MKLEKAIKRIENLIKSREDPRGKTELDFALNMAIEALKNIKVIDKIPEDYLYDAETDNFWVYRNKYTGKEIHILKPIDLFVLDRPHVECNQCQHYQGVHGVQGHAPCSFWGIGGVLSSDYCSRFEKEGEAE